MDKPENNQFIDVVKVREAQNGEWFYVGESNNGEILFTSETYPEKSTAVDLAGKLADQSGVSVEVKGG